MKLTSNMERVKSEIIASDSNIIFVSGLPGAGKTFVSNSLVETLEHCSYANYLDTFIPKFPDKPEDDFYIFDDIEHVQWTGFCEIVNWLVHNNSTVIIMSRRRPTTRSSKYFDDSLSIEFFDF
jgi:chromosomal replication initiation ATPase DnaA